MVFCGHVKGVSKNKGFFAIDKRMGQARRPAPTLQRLFQQYQFAGGGQGAGLEMVDVYA